MPDFFGAEAVATATYLKNRTPTRGLEDLKREFNTPFEGWFGRVSDLGHLRVWGCIVMGHVPAEKTKKLDGRSVKCVFVGYCLTEKQYKVYNPVTRRMSFTRDVVFWEGEKYAKVSSPTTDTTSTFGGKKIRCGSLKFSHIFEPFISKEEDIAVEELSMDGPAPQELQELPNSAEGDSSGSSVFFQQGESEVLPSQKKPSTWGKIGSTEMQALLETEGYQAPDLNRPRQM